MSSGGDTEGPLGEAIQSQPTAESEEHVSFIISRRGVAKKCADLIDSICSSDITPGVRGTEKVMLERRGVGDGRQSDFPLTAQIT